MHGRSRHSGDGSDHNIDFEVMIFADTHTHLYLEQFDADREAVVTNAINAGVHYLFLPNIDHESIDGMMRLADQFPDHCFPMIGLHPTSVNTEYQSELLRIEEELTIRRDRYVAIGEVGIDLYWSKEFQAEQLEAFEHQIDLALQYDLPVIIHTRNSMDEALEVIAKKHHPKLRGIFHCFSGNLAQANRAIELQLMLGIGGVVTYKNSGLQQVVASIDLEHLVLETDAPFLPPVPHRGQRNESAYIPIIAKRVAEIKEIAPEQVATITTKNAITLFQTK